MKAKLQRLVKKWELRQVALVESANLFVEQRDARSAVLCRTEARALYDCEQDLRALLLRERKARK